MLPANKDQHKPILVDFFAEWCGPCQTMEPVLNALHDKMQDEFEIIRIDVDQYPQAAVSYKIMHVPTFIYIKDGKELWRKSGLVPIRDLEELILKTKSGEPGK
ncbi:MAG: thioredoxin family protein [Chitinophagaceae bacterium]|nr:thioredoxin family protein [Chitinophagaceae bacterium]